MKAIVKNISIPNNKRVIAISDVHGNLKLLEEISYTPNDILNEMCQELSIEDFVCFHNLYLFIL